MEDRNLRSMKACIIDLQMQVTNITNTMNSYDYQVILPNHDIIKEALAELKKTNEDMLKATTKANEILYRFISYLFRFPRLIFLFPKQRVR